tara:strand:+ start:36249 stop:37103 length:855 start_codon:yes stop_codon:yes gene_type:complete
MLSNYPGKSIGDLERKSDELRTKTLDICVKAKTGHVTSCFSCAEIFATLYYGDVLRFDSKNPELEDRDRFILSKGQASPMLYAMLADLEFFPENLLDGFCKKGGKFGVHLQDTVPGVEITSGSLGHGLGIASGIALAAKMDRKNYHTFALLGDGECYEGSIWESAMFASQNRLNNLTAIVDRNWQCATNFTESSLGLYPLDEKWKAFGWDVKNIDGHSVKELLDAFNGFRSEKRNKPHVVIADTIKGKGSKYIESQVPWHSKAPTSEEAEIVREEIKLRRDYDG